VQYQLTFVAPWLERIGSAEYHERYRVSKEICIHVHPGWRLLCATRYGILGINSSLRLP
jgi:hypothetical protein